MFFFVSFFIFLFGLIVGSFLNCFIWRLHDNKSLGGRSICPKCRHQLAWYDNIPIFSFIFLRGRCRYCRQSISWQYPIVELITALLFLLAFLVANQQMIISQGLILGPRFIINLLRDWFLIAVMVVIFIYDLKWYLILDKITIPSLIILFIANLYTGYAWQAMLAAGLIGGGFFLIQFLISRGRWIGGGDIRLGLLMGVALGTWQLLLVAIMLAYLIGSVVGLGLILAKKKDWGSEVPLGVFLSTTTIVSLFFGKAIISWYLNLF